MSLDLLSRVLGIGAHASDLFSTTIMINVVSHRTQREHGLAPSGRMPHRRGGHTLSLAGFANSILKSYGREDPFEERPSAPLSRFELLGVDNHAPVPRSSVKVREGQAEFK